MAVEQYSISGDRKRKRWHGEKKLIVDDKVEVRSMEEGFLGSWHQGTVVRCGKLKRHVEYDNLVNDITSKFIVDIVEVPGILDGDTYEIYKERGYIRPVPPMVKFGKYDLPFGLCVDVFHDDAWWEGVIFDHNDGKKERSIFFPDLGDEMSFPIDHLHLRITQDWNGATDEWKRRGTWVFLKLVDEYEHDNYVAVSVKQIWYDVRAKKDFIKIEDWTHNVNKLWRDLVQEVIMDYFELTVREIFLRLNTSKDLLTESSDGAADIDINPERNSDSVDSDSNSDKQLIKSDVIYDAGPRNSHVYELSLVENHFEKDDISNSLDTEKEGLVQLESISPEEEISSDSEESSWQDDSSEDSYGARSYKRNRQGGLSTRKKQKDWKQLIISESKLCPESVHQYAFSYNSRNEQLMTTVREHIGCLGWKIEYIERTSSQRQYKYTAPEIEGKHVFMSLRQVCRHILRDKNVVYKKCSRELKSQDNQRSVYSTTDSSASLTAISPPHPVEFECKYCPGAVLRYYSLYSLKNTSRDFKKAMILEARKHLSAEGWRFQSQVIKRRGMLYISPRMRLFRSLQSACEACIREGLPRWIRSEIKAVDGLDIDEEQISQLDIKQLSNIVSELLSKNPELSVLDGIPESRSTGHCMTKPPKNRNSSSPKNQRKRLPIRLLRSSKRVQNERTPCPSNMKAQNVLSWLIDCNMLLPRSKVRYHARGTSRPMIEGRITRDGIKCSCCQQLYGIYGFGSHATGQRNCRSAAANIVLENGKSLLDLQRQIMNEYRTGETTKTRRKSEYREDNDGICTICHYGGELILCDNCPSSFHRSCIGLEDIPKGDWFCPTCCCGICCQNKIEGDDDEKLLTCSQCEHKYHAKCLRKRSVAMSGRYVKSWFCGKSCERIYAGLHRLLGEPIAIGVDNLKWTLLKCVDSENYDIKNGRNYLEVESYSKLNVALAVMHECFEPLVESYSGRDLVEDVIFSRRSKLNRLNFRGFYTVLLEKDEEVVTVANVRVYGKKVAEIPLVGTRFQHRRNGLCRILMDELEKRLRQLGVEKIVLPAVPSVLDTWTTSFGFSKMTNFERSQFLDCTFLDFQDTVMCQKLLIKTTTPTPILSTEIHSKTFDHQCSVVSEDQAEEIDRNETQDLLIVEYVAGNDDNLSKYAPNPVHSAEPVNLFEDQQMQDTFKGQKRQNGDAAVFKTYKRRKFITKL